MRNLLVWGALALCVLPAAASSDKPKSGNQSKGNAAQDQRRRPCASCYTPLRREKAVQSEATEQKGQLRITRQTEDKGGKKKPELLPTDVWTGGSAPIQRARSVREEPTKPSRPNRWRNNCPGCFTLIGLNAGDTEKKLPMRVSRQTEDRRGKKRRKNKLGSDISTPIGRSLDPLETPTAISKPSGRRRCTGCFSALAMLPAQTHTKLLLEEQQDQQDQPAVQEEQRRRRGRQKGKKCRKDKGCKKDREEHPKESEGEGRTQRKGRKHRGKDKTREKKREDDDLTPEKKQSERRKDPRLTHPGGRSVMSSSRFPQNVDVR